MAEPRDTLVIRARKFDCCEWHHVKLVVDHAYTGPAHNTKTVYDIYEMILLKALNGKPIDDSSAALAQTLSCIMADAFRYTADDSSRAGLLTYFEFVLKTAQDALAEHNEEAMMRLMKDAVIGGPLVSIGQ